MDQPQLQTHKENVFILLNSLQTEDHSLKLYKKEMEEISLCYIHSEPFQKLHEILF
jgi:hypothetical protein